MPVRVGTVAGWSAAAGYAWVAAGFPSFSWQSTAAVLVAGAAVIGRGLRVPPRPPPAIRFGRTAALVWAVPVLAFGALELTNDALGSSAAHPTLSILLDPVLAHHPVRWAFYFGWLAAGWQLVRR